MSENIFTETKAVDAGYRLEAGLHEIANVIGGLNFYAPWMNDFHRALAAAASASRAVDWNLGEVDRLRREIAELRKRPTLEEVEQRVVWVFRTVGAGADGDWGIASARYYVLKAIRALYAEKAAQ